MDRVNSSVKPLLASLVVLGLIGGIYASGVNPGQVSTDNGLVAEYRFDTGAGNTAYDTSGNNNDGTVNGATWTSGVEGKALSFEGSEYVKVGSSPKVDFGDKSEITISLWAKIEEGLNDDNKIVAKSSTFNFQPQYSTASETQMRWEIHTESSGWTGCITDNGYTEVGEWAHYTTTWDGSTAKLYKNGELWQTCDINGHFDPAGDSSNLCIGGGFCGSDDVRASIDKIQIYSEPLNSSQISSLYNTGSWRIDSDNQQKDPSKILDLDFQHVQNGQVLDTSGNNNHGIINNEASQVGAVECQIGKCFSFDGIDDRVEISSNSYLNSMENGYTWLIWFKGNNQETNYPRLIDFGDTTLRVDGIEGDFRAWTSTDGSRCNYVVGDDAGMGNPDSQWHHVTVVYNRTHNRLFVDGVLNSEGTCSGTLDTGYDLTIGAENNGGAEFDGKIDQVQIYNRSLSKKEIWRLYTDGRDRNEGMAGPVGRWRFDDAAVYTENFIPNGDFTGGSGIPSEYGSNPTNKIVRMENPGNSDWVLRQNGSSTEYEIHFKDGTIIKANTTYAMSSWVAYTDDWNGDNQIFHARWYDGDGNSYTSGGSGHLIETMSLGGLTWEHRYETITTPSTVNGDFNWYWGWAASNTDGYRYLTNAQLEAKEDATDFVDGIREERVPDSAEDNNGQMGTSEGIDSGDPDVVEGKIGQALRFDGNDDRVNAGQPEELEPEEELTVAAWVNPDTTSCGGTNECVVTHYRHAYIFGVSNGNVWLNWRNSNDDWYTQTGGSVPDGEWTHIATTIDFSDNEGKFYVNGEKAKTFSSSGSAFHTVGRDFMIGKGDNSFEDPFNGKIDDVRIYPYALDQQQVKQVMNSGSVTIG